jgi:hypothetical protein
MRRRRSPDDQQAHVPAAVEVAVDGKPWRAVESFADAGPGDHVYVLEPERGILRFGDGIRGCRPPSGSAVTVRYRYGQGREVAVTDVWPFRDLSHTIELQRSGTIQVRTVLPVDDEDPDGSVTRVRYFFGQLLTAAEFTAEQDYFRERLRRHNRALHGVGVVRGLELSVAGDTVHVAPGVAIDARGEELVVAHPLDLQIPAGVAWYVTLAFAECETDPAPTPEPGAVEFTRVREHYRIAFASAPLSGAISLGRLVRDRDSWTVSQPPA